MLDRAEAVAGVRAHAERVAAELRDQFPTAVEIRLRFPERGDADAVLQLVGSDLEFLREVKIAAAHKTAALLDEDDIFIELQTLPRPAAAVEHANGSGEPS